MSDKNYPNTPLKDLDLAALRTYSLGSRSSKVSVQDMGQPLGNEASFSDLVSSLPNVLAAKDLKEAAAAIATARKKGRGVVLGMGAHPLKVGLGLHLVDAIEKGLLTGIATNGAAIIHDFELAVAGMTSEDVGAALGSGKFGMAEETAISLNGAIANGASEGNGIGSSVGELIDGGRFEHANLSIFAAATRTKIPATVHVAIGTDIIHMHPSCDGAATGAATLTDFLLLARQVAALDEGVYINLGSAVIMPEVFLKAFSLAKNLGHQVKNLTTINMDFIQHYRPTVNVLQRPTAGGGRGYALTGNHEILLPLLLSAVKELL